MSPLVWILVLPIVAGMPLAMLGALRGRQAARTRALLGVGGISAPRPEITTFEKPRSVSVALNAFPMRMASAICLEKS